MVTTALAPSPIELAPAPPAIRLDENGRLVPFSVVLTCTENRFGDDVDGGLVFLQIGRVLEAQEPGIAFNGFNVAMGFRNDGVGDIEHGDPDGRTEMHAFPRTREEMRRRAFRVTLEEVEYPTPPAPAGPLASSEVEQLRARIRELEAQQAASAAAVS